MGHLTAALLGLNCTVNGDRDVNLAFKCWAVGVYEAVDWWAFEPGGEGKGGGLGGNTALHVQWDAQDEPMRLKPAIQKELECSEWSILRFTTSIARGRLPEG